MRNLDNFFHYWGMTRKSWMVHPEHSSEDRIREGDVEVTGCVANGVPTKENDLMGAPTFGEPRFEGEPPKIKRQKSGDKFAWGVKARWAFHAVGPDYRRGAKDSDGMGKKDTVLNMAYMRCIDRALEYRTIEQLGFCVLAGDIFAGNRGNYRSVYSGRGPAPIAKGDPGGGIRCI